MTGILADFCNHNTISNIPKPQAQSDIQQKSNYEYTKIILPAAVGGAATGTYAYFKQTRNVNMKYALFAKEQLKNFTYPEADKAYFRLLRFRGNPVSQYKNLPRIISNIEAEIVDADDVKKLNLEKLKITLEQILNKHKIRFLDIKSSFVSNFIKQTILKVSKFAAGGLALGAGAGLIWTHFTNKQEAGNNESTSNFT